jgi:NAD(P)-dependent dehydrogenase (short-subunit alcohol dehydrogenase family)
MPPSGLAILIGAGPNTGTGIARVLSSASQGNLAVALLARRSDSIKASISKVRETNPDAVLEAFPSDTSKASLEKAFKDIQAHQSFRDLKLKLAVFSIKHSSKKPFLEETREDFEESLETYVGGAFTFAQESLKRMFADNGEKGLPDGGEKKGVSLHDVDACCVEFKLIFQTIIFTGTLGALRCSAQFAAYGAGRSSVRQLAQTLAREMSEKGVHVVHTIANGGIADENGEAQKTGKKMSADAVGETYLWLHQQKPCLWTHELDMRPACEKF